MTNGEKILVGLVVIVAIITGVLVITNKRLGEAEKEKQIDNNSIFDVVDNNHQKEDINNEIESEDLIENTIQQNETNTNNVDGSNTQQQITGREEQESKTENTGADNEKTAIELAKKEWGIDVDSYDYVAQMQGEGIYEVTVRNRTGNRNSIAIYNVNVLTGAVVEK